MFSPFVFISFPTKFITYPKIKHTQTLKNIYIYIKHKYVKKQIYIYIYEFIVAKMMQGLPQEHS